jgi:hypothetical protein
MLEGDEIMASPWAQPTDVHAPSTQGSTGAQRAGHAEPSASPQESSLVRSARRFAARCHVRQQRTSDGAAFIEHLLEVARLLRDAGCSDVLIAAGLLHDIVEDTHVTVAELTARFGADIANLVQVVSEDASIHGYRRRKHGLREQVRHAGTDAALLFAADKISKVREFPDRARLDAPARETHARGEVEHDQQMRIEHYQESLLMLQRIAPQHPLVTRLANELESTITPTAGSVSARGERDDATPHRE